MCRSQDYCNLSGIGKLPARVICLAVLFSSLECEVRKAVAADAAAASVTGQLPYTNQYSGEYYTADLGDVFRLRHIEGEGQGGVPAYTNFGFTKFVWGPGGVLMFDVGGRVTNDAVAGFTGGIHRRAIVRDVIFGGGLFTDVQEDFSQMSLAFEIFTRNWSFREWLCGRYRRRGN